MIGVAELGTKSVWRSASAPALIDADNGSARSFGQLSGRVRCLAAALSGVFGAGPGRRVAVLSRNCAELIELYLGAAAAGTLLFPLNWRLSAAELATALADAAPVAVFYEDAFAGVVDELRAGPTRLADTWVRWEPGRDSEYEELLREVAGPGRDPAGGPGAAAPRLPVPGSLLHQPYLAISTGGTTGIAKSAVHSQFSYGACALNYLAAARIRETDAYLMLGQLFHVVGYMPLAYLAMGRPVVIASFEPARLVEIIERERVSGFFAIATMLPRMIAAVKASSSPQRAVASVRQVEYGGAPTGESVIRDAASVFDAGLMQAWGMTELGPGTYLGPEDHRQALAGHHPERLRSCGRAALLSTVAVLDEAGRPVPQDGTAMGEICHRGPGNMTSYWNKPAETDALLRDGWVHSGDVGTWDDEGYVYIVDRMKSMIISGGENIFPAEIERVLADHPRIAEVVVVGARDPEWGEVVKAVVVPVPGAAPTEAEVRDYVESRLGSYKKPRIVEFRSALPATPTGKVDRSAL